VHFEKRNTNKSTDTCHHDGVTTSQAYGNEARYALANGRWSIVEASEFVKPVPGLYSIHALEAGVSLSPSSIGLASRSTSASPR